MHRGTIEIMDDPSDQTDVTEPKARWARKYDRCVGCGRTDVRHRAQGLCAKCYEKESHIRNRGYRISGQEGRKKLTREYLIKQYVRHKRSMIDIAKGLGCSRQAVLQALKKFGIASRSLAKASDLALRRGKKRVTRIDESGHRSVTTLDRIKVNEQFFSLWSPAMAYVLGVIYADGSVDPGYKIDPERRSISKPRLSISQKEPELLQKVLHLMECNAKLQYHKEYRRGSIVAGALYCFQISSETIYKDLLSLGVTPNKSLTLSFPQISGRELISGHFVRGCWDGDGTVHVPGDLSIANPYASIVSGSLNFMTGLIEHFYHVGIKRRSGEGDHPLNIHMVKKSYDLRITGRTNLTTLFHYLYDGVDSSMRLERKYLKFVEIMRRYDLQSRWRQEAKQRRLARREDHERVRDLLREDRDQ
jgi:hypothetical protein